MSYRSKIAALIVMGAMLSAGGYTVGCSAATTTKVQSGVASGAAVGLACAKVDLTQMVDGGPLLTLVAIDVVSGNYVDLIATLIGKIGSDIVGCAVLAVQAVFDATKVTTTVTPAIAAASTATDEHIAALKAKYGWKPAVTPPAKP